MDKNPSANAGGTDSILGPRRFHIPRSNKARAPQLLSLQTAHTKARTPRACTPQEKPPRGACELQ